MKVCAVCKRRFIPRTKYQDTCDLACEGDHPRHLLRGVRGQSWNSQWDSRYTAWKKRA